MTDLPKWAVERGREIVAAVLEGSAGAYSIKQTPEETAAELVAYVARALADAAMPGWINTSEGVSGQRYLLAIDGQTYEGYCAHPESLWFFANHDRVKGVPDAIMPLPAAPEVG